MTVYREDGDRFSKSWRGRWCEIQRPPFSRPLPYTLMAGSQTGRSSGRMDDIRNTVPLANGQDTTRGVALASNKALSKVYDKLGQAESLRVAFAERQKSLDMVTERFRSLITIARAVRKRDPRIVRRVLRRNPKARDIIKQPAGLWLEYWFGWSPLISDIHHALGIFGFEFPVTDLFGVGREKTSVYFEQGAQNGSIWSYEFDTIVKIGGRITAIDPNVSLASRLGFGQPLSVAWELTPFSWVVDYVINVGDFIKNMEPQFPGITISDKYTTRYMTCHGFVGEKIWGKPGKKDVNYVRGAYMQRTTSWPSYQLVFNNPLGLSGQRISYLVAVFAQIMSGMKKS